MRISIFPVTERFAAEVGDIDLARPLDAETLQAVRDAFATHAVLVFLRRPLGAAASDFARNFGPLEVTVQPRCATRSCAVREEIAASPPGRERQLGP